MKDIKMNTLTVGTLVSLPCEIKEGAIANEKFVKCDLGDLTIEGAIPNDFTDVYEKRVIAVVYELLMHNMLRLYFNGDIFQPGNPVTISKKILEEKGKIIDS